MGRAAAHPHAAERHVILHGGMRLGFVATAKMELVGGRKDLGQPGWVHVEKPSHGGELSKINLHWGAS